MLKIRPFKAVRPANDKVHLVASRSYVTYNDEQLRDKLRHNPYSFVQVIHPDFDSDDPSDPGTHKRFERVRDRYRSFTADGVFVRDTKPAFYVYRQSSAGVDSLGIVAAAHADDYRSGRIKIHEQTLAVREALFADYLEVTGFNAEPILLTHDDDDELNGWLTAVSGRTPDVHFTTADEITHRLWVVDGDEDCRFVEAAYARFDALYIADGHHRSASSVLLADRLAAAGQLTEAAAHFMVYILPKSRLKIHGYHRLIRHIGIDVQRLLDGIRAIPGVTVREVSREVAIPKSRHIDLYLSGLRYRIDLPEDLEDHHPDAEWLTLHILAPLLGIADLRNDQRIAFEPETTGVANLCRSVDQGRFEAVFILHPVPFDQLKAVADRRETMPPKSTWIEPKLRSGLVVYDFTFADTIAL